MSDELEKHGVKLASNQVEFSLLRSRALTSGLLAEMNKRDVRLLACEWPQTSPRSFTRAGAPGR